MKIDFELTAEPKPEDLAQLGDRLMAYNDAEVGPANRTALAVFVRDEENAIVGGISGYTGWGWLYVQWLWIDGSLRGQNIAARMLQAAEAEAVRRGCHAAYIDTFNPVALKVYQRQGYSPFGTLQDFPMGHVRTFLAKSLPGAP